MGIVRYVTPAEAALTGWEHATANHDILMTDGGGIFWRTDDNSSGTADINTGATVSLKANQYIFIDGRFEHAAIDMTFFGVDTLLIPGATRRLICTNIAGQAKFTKLSFGGIKNVDVTFKYEKGVSGDLYYRGHDSPGIFEGSSGKYGCRGHNPNNGAPVIWFGIDIYGTMPMPSSDMSLEYAELSGGFACFQAKNDDQDDDGYYHITNIQAYVDTTTPDYDWATSSAYLTGEIIRDPGTGKRRYTVQGDYTSGATSSISDDIGNGDLVEKVKATGKMMNMELHDVYIHDSGRENVYIGNTSTSANQHGCHFRITNNRFIRSGGETLQFGRAIPNMDKYDTNPDDSVTQWKTIVKNNVIVGGGSQWLRGGGNGALGFQDKGSQLGCRLGGIEISHNIMGMGASDALFWQMDGSGDHSGNNAWFGTQSDKDTHVWVHHNYFIGSRDRLIFFQKVFMDGVTQSHATFEDNYLAEFNFTFDILQGGGTSSYLFTGTDDVTYMNLTNNVLKGSRDFSFGTNDRVIETGTTYSPGMDLIEMVNSGWDNPNEEYKEHEWWVLECGENSSGYFRDYVIGNKCYKDNTDIEKDRSFECITNHASNDPNAEPDPYNTVPEEIGIIYSKTMGDNYLADWTIEGTDVSWTQSGTDLVISGSKGTGGSGASDLFHDRLVLNTTDFDFTCLPKWKFRMNIITGTANGTSFGLGMGVNSVNTFEYNDTICRVGGDSGSFYGDHLYYYNNTDSAGINGQRQSAFADLDDQTEYWYEFERDELTLSITVYDAGGTTSISTSTYTENLSNGAYIHANTGRFAIHQYGGNNTIKSVEISSTSMKNCDFAFMGDSITYGGKASSLSNIWIEEFMTLRGLGEVGVNLGGWADRALELEMRKEEVKALNPKYIFIAVGSNDSSQSEWTSTGDGKVDDMITYFEANTTAQIVLVTPTARNDVSVAQVKTDMDLKGKEVIDLYTLTKTGGTGLTAGYNSGDGIHLTDSGHDACAAEAILATFSTWEDYWVEIPRLRADDWRLVQGSTYHTLGIGLSSSYDTKYTSPRIYSGNSKNINSVI